MKTRNELYITTRDTQSGKIVGKRKVTIDEIKNEILSDKYFKHFLFWPFRVAVAMFVINKLETFKHK